MDEPQSTNRPGASEPDSPADLRGSNEPVRNDSGKRASDFAMSAPGADDDSAGAIASGKFTDERLRSWPTGFEWLLIAMGVYLAGSYAWLLDDAFVYFRYGDNALHLGHGLVYNRGEYVEGYSSPLWMMLLLLARSSGLDWWGITRILGLVCLVLTALMAVRVNRKLAPRGSQILNVPLIYLMGCYAVLCYFSSGLETPLVQVSAAVFALFALNPSSRGLQALLGLAPLVRHEFALPLATAICFLWLRERKFPLGFMLWSALPILAWISFRVIYYADFLPNTFYLKDSTDWSQGLVYLNDAVSPYFLPLLLSLGVLASVALILRGQRDQLELDARALMLIFALPVAVYAVRIGGDPRHYRYLAFSICLTVLALGGLAERVLAHVSPAARSPASIGFGLALFALIVSCYPVQLQQHPLRGDQGNQIIGKINDAAYHRERIELPRWGSGRTAIEQKGRYRLWLEEHPEGEYESVIAAKWCRNLYKRFDQRSINSLGLTDPILARTNMDSDRPAHKRGLKPLAENLAELQRHADWKPEVGATRAAVEAGRAAYWIRNNLGAIEAIERKIYNDHDPLQNLKLALTPTQRIEP